MTIAMFTDVKLHNIAMPCHRNGFLYFLFFEKALSKQLPEYFDKICDDFLRAFRKGHGCQTTRIRLLEDALDNIKYTPQSNLRTTQCKFP